MTTKRVSCAAWIAGVGLVVLFVGSHPGMRAEGQQPPPAPVVLKTTLVGVVLPADARPGDTISGTVVTNPEQYNDVPALRVVTAEIPLPQDAQGHASLEGVVIDTGDGKRQPADRGLLIALAANAAQIPLIFHRADTPAPVAERAVPIARPGDSFSEAQQPPPVTTISDAPTPARPGTNPPEIPRPARPGTNPPETPRATRPGTNPPEIPRAARPGTNPPETPRPAVTPPEYQTPPVCVEDRLQVIRGPFGGNRGETQILVDDQPAPIIAETPRAAYWRLPEGIEPGPHRLTVRERGVEASFPVVVLRIAMTADQVELLKGQSTRFRAVVSGPEKLPESAWRSGVPSDLTNVGRLRETAPDFKIPPRQAPGVILLRIENGSRDTVTISPSKNETVVQTLGREQFANGPYTFSGTIKSKRSGRFNIRGQVVPFLAPVAGEPVPSPRGADAVPQSPPSRSQ